MIRDLEIYCANCGKRYTADISRGWIESNTHTRVCGKECHDELEQRYYHIILASDVLPENHRESH